MKTCVLSKHPVTIAYDDSGNGPSVVVLLHAFPLSRDMWGPQHNMGDGLRVLALDFPGFGDSSPLTGDLTIETLADVVADFVQTLGFPHVVLGGLSMGGYVALAFARRHPALLQGLILADTKAEADDDDARANRNTMMAFAEAHPAADVIEQMIPRLLAEPARAGEAADDVRRMGGGQAPAAIVAALRALRDRPDATAGLEAIAVPTLVIVGEHDAITPPEFAIRMADRIPNARLVIIPGAGHLSNLEAPDAFNRAVSAFVKTLPAV